jgi:hypothetical protein
LLCNRTEPLRDCSILDFLSSIIVFINIVDLVRSLEACWNFLRFFWVTDPPSLWFERLSNLLCSLGVLSSWAVVLLIEFWVYNHYNHSIYLPLELY